MPHVEAEMWKQYVFEGVTVRVIQKWTDPFGKGMIRVADVNDANRALGLAEDDFLKRATPLDTQDDAEIE